MDILIRLAAPASGAASVTDHDGGSLRGSQPASSRWLQRVLTEPPKTVYSAELKPGERLEIRTIPPNS